MGAVQMPEEKQAGPEAVNDALLNAANAGPAILTNRFVISIGPYGVRVAFMEQTKGVETSAFRSAVVMSHQDGILFYKLLRDLLKNVEGTLEAAAAAAAAEAETTSNG
jgi:hypothetical protein